MIRNASPVFTLSFTVDRAGRIKKRRASCRGLHVRFVRRGLYRVSGESLRLLRKPSVFAMTEAKNITVECRDKKKATIELRMWARDRDEGNLRLVTPWEGIHSTVYVQVFDWG